MEDTTIHTYTPYLQMFQGPLIVKARPRRLLALPQLATRVLGPEQVCTQALEMTLVMFAQQSQGVQGQLRAQGVIVVLAEAGHGLQPAHEQGQGLRLLLRLCFLLVQSEGLHHELVGLCFLGTRIRTGSSLQEQRQAVRVPSTGQYSDDFVDAHKEEAQV